MKLSEIHMSDSSSVDLKGHGNEPVFRSFCINRFGHSRSDLGLEFAEIFIDSLQSCREGNSREELLSIKSLKLGNVKHAMVGLN